MKRRQWKRCRRTERVRTLVLIRTFIKNIKLIRTTIVEIISNKTLQQHWGTYNITNTQNEHVRIKRFAAATEFTRTISSGRTDFCRSTRNFHRPRRYRSMIWFR